ncbi:hypothetical protein DL93DRAFT_1211369 [Clavulina sp. PMI_390]|nr:hypothetical protein DL93DRAFT_1211369 [Clavulina sp. PMI_390]
MAVQARRKRTAITGPVAKLMGNLRTVHVGGEEVATGAFSFCALSFVVSVALPLGWCGASISSTPGDPADGAGCLPFAEGLPRIRRGLRIRSALKSLKTAFIKAVGSGM